MRDALEFVVGFSIVIAGAFAAIFALAFVMSVTIGRAECATNGRMLGVNAEYDTVAGCFVTVDGRTMKLDDYRTIQRNEHKVEIK